jgi:hypothetical protein
MNKSQKKNRLYNAATKRFYKSCRQKKKDTHPVTKKCRKRCKSEKIRRADDFRRVKKYNKKGGLNTPTLRASTPKASTPKASTPKSLTPKASTPKSLTPKASTPKSLTPKASTPMAKEELVPLPLQKELKNNFKFLDDLIEKGKGEKGIFKTANYGEHMASEMVTIYFHEKYKQSCPMYTIKTYSTFDSDNYKKYYNLKKEHNTEAEVKEYLLKEFKYEYSEWNKDKFLKNLKLCLDTGEQIIMVPLLIPGHLNMLIIKEPTREIIRFEPHGSRYYDIPRENETNTFLEKLTTEINDYLNLVDDNKKFTYKNPSQLCPNYKPTSSNYKIPGFQTMEGRARVRGKEEGGGFCQLWSWFFAECIIQNPKRKVEEVYAEAFDWLEINEPDFATIIRGYFFSINDELKKMNKTYTLEKGDRPKWDVADIFMDYLKQSQDKLKNKPRKTFQNGGSTNSNFIVPKANPKAAQVHF